MSRAPQQKVFFVSLGCPKNRVDSEIMLGELTRRDYAIVGSADDADVLVVNTADTTLTVPRSELMASAAARVQVVVSDGVHSAAAISNQFAADNSAPDVQIISPLDGDIFSGLQNIDLVANAFDAEDGGLTGGSFSWSSDLDGGLGGGKRDPHRG